MAESRASTRVSVVLETASVHPTDSVSIEDCLASLARQDYPRALIEVIAVDGGKVPGFADLVRRTFPAARVLSCPGGTKFEQKNLGMQVSSGDVVARSSTAIARRPRTGSRRSSTRSPMRRRTWPACRA